MNKQQLNNVTYKTIDEQRRTVTEKPPWNGQSTSYWELKPGPSSSKLTTLLVNDSLKFTSSDTQIC